MKDICALFFNEHVPLIMSGCIACVAFSHESGWYPYIENLSQKTPREKKHYERIRYLFYLLYLLAPRVSEVAQATMQSIKLGAGNGGGKSR